MASSRAVESAKSGSVYGRVAQALLSAAIALGALPQAQAQGPDKTGDGIIVDARDALRKKDRNRLAADRDAALAAAHPLAMWADYFDATNRIAELQQADLDAFYARWPGSYVEDRLRNDWLLELGKRRDWRNLAAEFPRFRMNDDREVGCYALLADHLGGRPVARDTALAAWLAQRDADDGCTAMGSALVEAGVLKPADAWRKARAAMDANRPRAARAAAALANPANTANPAALAELTDTPARYLARKASVGGRDGAELATLALIRLAANGSASDTDAAAGALTERWERALPGDLAAWAWSAVAKQSAQRLSPDASDQFQRAERAQARNDGKNGAEADWPDDTLAWKARAALRANNGAGRWQQVVQAVNAMSATEQREPAWVYWKARGLQALAKDSQDGEALRAQATEMFAGIAGQYHFYGKLAADAIGQPLALPPRPQPLAAAERDAAARNPALARALQLIAIGLRSEGVREWNFTLRGMADRELLAAAQLACDREVWDRCINTSDRTRGEVDMAQRFPMPHRREVLARSKEIGLDAAYVYGLIRQESRFIMDARSGVGASGLMQIMPATARWTANRIGLPYSADMIADRNTNLILGTSYLKLVLDDFGGSQALAAAAYNAGPGRPRKWRDGPWLEPAAWAENIPFAETRDYVKKVLSNSVYYAALLGGDAATLKARLGRPIGPRDAAAPASDGQLP